MSMHNQEIRKGCEINKMINKEKLLGFLAHSPMEILRKNVFWSSVVAVVL